MSTVNTVARVREYVEKWRDQGYPDDIPDEAPPELERLQLAPSYRAVAVAILRNDLGLHSLGFAPPTSEWYGILKRVELEDRAARNAQYQNAKVDA